MAEHQALPLRRGRSGRAAGGTRGVLRGRSREGVDGARSLDLCHVCLPRRSGGTGFRLAVILL